ncbi:MAG: hypothetical protein ACE5I3_09455 [Phycisphaerae bacterium]
MMHRYPFTIDPIVVLPDHLHAIWTLAAGHGGFAARWSAIKAAFSRSFFGASGREGERSRSRRKRGERGVWQITVVRQDAPYSR